MGLPYFRFHPDPIRTGAIVRESIVCQSCNKHSEFNYRGPFSCSIDFLCPDCILNGAAAKKFDGEFHNSEDFIGRCGDVISPDIIEELTQRTPGFLGAQQEIWLCLGGMPGVYEGDFCKIKAPFMTDEFWQKVKDDNELWDDAEFNDLKTAALRGGISLHVFKDLNSDKRSAYFDYT